MNSSSLYSRTLRNLDWQSLTHALMERARSPLGKDLAERIAPLPSQGAAEQRLKLLDEAGHILQNAELRNLIGLPALLSDVADPLPAFHRSSRGGVLDPQEIFISGKFMESITLVGEGLRQVSAESEIPSLQGLFRFAPKAVELVAIIKRSVNFSGEILDTASTDLKKFRQMRTEKRVAIQKTLQNRVRRWHDDGLLQDDFFDQIDGRFVVPLRADHRGEISGHILAQSQSRQSLFIEPLEFVAENNELQTIEAKVRFEELRILRELSQRIGDRSSEFLAWVEPLAELDFIFAATDLARDWTLVRPVFSDGLILKNLTHPYLKAAGKKAIGNDIQLEGQMACVISGPNTGGKTVLLKALALNALMAKCGLFISAKTGSQLPFYRNVVALVGDDQNLSDGLSSFSSQVRDMKAVMAEVEPVSLILVDEILSSTDPEEATALSTAILKKLITAGHNIFMTTHFSGLAQNALRTEKTTVAAMEFQNHSPTYRFLPNQMGQSHALEVATLLGLDHEVLKEAQNWMNPEKLDYQGLSLRLQESLRDVEARSAVLESNAQMELQDLRAELETQFQEKLSEFLQRSEDEIRILERKYEAQAQTQSLAKRPQEKISELKKTKDELKNFAKEILKGPVSSEAKRHDSSPTAPGTRTPEKGLEVKVKDHIPLWGGRYGIIATWNAVTKKATISMGALRTELEDKDFTVEGKPKKTGAPMRKVKKSYQASSETYSSTPSSTLNLRGLRGIEVKESLEKFLDSALSTGASSVKVVTGHGSGAVKAAFLEVIKSLNYIQSYKPERPGDDGAWIVEF